MLKAGIVGLPNVGKSTLFNALVANAQAEAANYPFCTIEPNSGIVSVPDPRLQLLSDVSGSKEIIPTKVEFVDIAGLVKGASQGEGLGNKFLANIREVDAIVHVVRCFENDDVIHVSGSVGPARDAEVINLELGLADLSQVEKRRERLKKQVRTSKEAQLEDAVLERIQVELEAGGAARNVATAKPKRSAAAPKSAKSTKRVAATSAKKPAAKRTSTSATAAKSAGTKRTSVASTKTPTPVRPKKSTTPRSATPAVRKTASKSPRSVDHEVE